MSEIFWVLHLQFEKENFWICLKLRKSFHMCLSLDNVWKIMDWKGWAFKNAENPKGLKPGSEKFQKPSLTVLYKIWGSRPYL